MSPKPLIDELRAQLNDTWHLAKRQFPTAELDLARAELYVIIVQLSGARDTDPPFLKAVTALKRADSSLRLGRLSSRPDNRPPVRDVI